MTTELICTHAQLLAAELAAIEQKAAQNTKSLLDNQESFLAAHKLANLLKAKGAPENTTPKIVYQTFGKPDIMFYAHHTDSAENVLNALQDTRLPYHINPGYSADVLCVTVEGYDGVEIVFPAAVLTSGVPASAQA